MIPIDAVGSLTPADTRETLSARGVLKPWTAGMTVVDGKVKMGWGAGTANGNVCGRTMICRVPLILRVMLVRVGRGMGAAGSTRTSTAVSHNLKDEDEADGDQLRPGLGKRWVWMQEG